MINLFSNPVIINLCGKDMPMNFNDFVQGIASYFTNELGEEYTVTITEVLKNNNIRLNGILMKKKGQRFTPNIYLNGYYERFVEGESMDQILEEIWSTYTMASESLEDESMMFDMEFEAQMNSIVYRLINYEKNQEKLEEMPHIRFLNLAITFHCNVICEEHAVSMLPVTNQLMEFWNTDVKQLLQLAHKNTPTHFPMVYSSLQDLMKMAIETNHPDAIYAPVDSTINMYVISNKQGVNGASVVLYEQAFQRLVDKLGGEVYILPSSIHELILVPYEQELDNKQLNELVREVNETQIPYEDVLSDHAYYYSSFSRKFRVL